MDYEKLIRNALGRVNNPDKQTRVRVYRSAMNAFEKKFGHIDNDVSQNHRKLLANAIQNVEAEFAVILEPVAPVETAPPIQSQPEAIPEPPVSQPPPQMDYSDPVADPSYQAAPAPAVDDLQVASPAMDGAAKPEKDGPSGSRFLIATAIVVAILMAAGAAYVYYISQQPVSPIRVDFESTDTE